jgi:hypothetical protein
MTGELPAGRVVAIRGGEERAATTAVRLAPGQLDVVLVVGDLPVADLAPGTRLETGEGVVLELVGGGEAEHNTGDGLAEVGGERAPSLARVLTPGLVRVGDPVTIGAVPVPIEDALDLHPFRPDEIAEVVREYVGRARAAGLAEVRVIHGRGRGVQRETVHRLLRRLPGVAGFADAEPERGGWGATVVRLELVEPPSA